MKQSQSILFSLSTVFYWSVESQNKKWLNQNIAEFKSSHQAKPHGKNVELSITEIEHIKIDVNAIHVSEGIYALAERVYIKDKYSNKLIHFKSLGNAYTLEVENGFTFHYYAALLDAFIKLLAFKKDIVTLHASAIKHNNQVSVFSAWRRMGKTTAVLNILAKDETVQILADDAVFITAEGQLIPYLRGIDLYPYLPIPNRYLNANDRLKRLIARGIERLPLLPNKISNKLLKRFFLPRLNLAKFGHGNTTKLIPVDKFYAIKKHLKPRTQKNNISASELVSFIGRSSYFEIIEYQGIFEMVCSAYPESSFAELIIDHKTFQEKVNHAISSDSTMLELNLPEDYSDISSINTII